MKKTLILLATLAGMSLSAHAATTFTTGNMYYNGAPGPGNQYSGMGNGNYYGVKINLSNSSWTTTTSSDSVTPLPTTVDLNSFTVLKRSGTPTGNNVKIAILDVDGNIHFSDNSINDNNGAAYSAMTFTFGSMVEISTTQILTFWFVDSNATADNWANNKKQLGLHGSRASATPYPVPDPPAGQQGWLDSAAGNAQSGWAPIISISTSAIAVPEPATASLGLLGLSALLLRRRKA